MHIALDIWWWLETKDLHLWLISHTNTTLGNVVTQLGYRAWFDWMIKTMWRWFKLVKKLHHFQIDGNLVNMILELKFKTEPFWEVLQNLTAEEMGTCKMTIKITFEVTIARKHGMTLITTFSFIRKISPTTKNFIESRIFHHASCFHTDCTKSSNNCGFKKNCYSTGYDLVTWVRSITTI